LRKLDERKLCPRKFLALRGSYPKFEVESRESFWRGDGATRTVLAPYIFEFDSSGC
jgi:hypothetical protein